MARQLAVFLVGLVVLYALAATGFAFGHYEGSMPGVGQVIDDFHGWLGDVFVGRQAPAVPREPRASAPPAPPAATSAPAAAPPDVPLDDEGKALLKIEREVLPTAMKRARELRTMSRANADAFERARTEILAALSETRPLLNEILERDSGHAKANRLWSQMQELYTAVKKL